MSSCSASSNIRSQLFAPILYLESSGTRIAFTIDTANTGYTIGSGITGGTIIRYDPSTLSYVPSNAKEASTAEVLGVVESLTYSAGATVFMVISSGLINYPGLTSVPDLYTPGGACSPQTTLSGGRGGKDILFLSDGCTGSVQFIEPSTPGAIVKPVMQVMKTSSHNAMVLNYIGYEVGEEAQAEFPIDGFVGQIIYIPSTVVTTSIPFGYLRIDNQSLVDVATYPELYDLFGTQYGVYIEEVAIQQPVIEAYNGQPASQASIWTGQVESVVLGGGGNGKLRIKKNADTQRIDTSMNITVANYNLTPVSGSNKVINFTVPRVNTTTQTFSSNETSSRTVTMIPYIKAKNNLSFVSIVNNLKLQGLSLGQILDVEATLDHLCVANGACP